MAAERLVALMARLRDPDGGCPWDLEQSFETVAPYTIEEAYEVDEAIRRGDLEELRGELGDLLFQVVFHARMAEEAGHFAFADVVEAICDKMERRHPHVFGDAPVGSWEAQKEAERAARGETDPLADVPAALPALMRAAKLQKRAERAGLAPEAVATALTEQELGDRLFALAAEARAAGLDAEKALREANGRFEARAREAHEKKGRG